MITAVPFFLTSTDALDKTNRMWAMWRCKLTSIRKWGKYYLWVGASDILAEECILLMTMQLLSFIHIEMCAGNPGGRGGYFHGWAAAVGEQGWPVALRSTNVEHWWQRSSHRMCPALVALTQDMLCLHNADVTLGAATNRDRQNSC